MRKQGEQGSVGQQRGAGHRTGAHLPVSPTPFTGSPYTDHQFHSLVSLFFTYDSSALGSKPVCTRYYRLTSFQSTSFFLLLPIIRAVPIWPFAGASQRLIAILLLMLCIYYPIRPDSFPVHGLLTTSGNSSNVPYRLGPPWPLMTHQSIRGVSLSCLLCFST